MKLPNAEGAVVAPEKITHYLLSFTSPNGRPKANSFTRFGFRASEWEVFAEALCLLCLENEVVDIKETIHGVQYVIIGMIPTPDGRNPTIRTVWQIDSGTDFPRLITARRERQG